MKQALSIIGVVVLFIVALGGVYLLQQQRIDELQSQVDELESNLAGAQSNNENGGNKQPDSTLLLSEKGVEVRVTAPTSGSTVTSPLRVTGSVPGNWSHEAQFTIYLLNKDGETIAETAATLQGEWMTEEMVPFIATLTFDAMAGETGTLKLVKANPSGLESNIDSVAVPVQF